MIELSDAAAPMVTADRSGVIESVHVGIGLAIDGLGEIVAAVGRPIPIYPRSCLKPLQADAMAALGLSLPADLMALVCASHSGEPVHVDGVRRLLATHGLDESQLRNTASWPLDPTARGTARAVGDVPSPIFQNCSGKHAGMLATCVVNGWSTDDYLAVDHPLQVAIGAHVGTLTGGVEHVGIDGCGAPTHVVDLLGLARAFAMLATTGSAVAAAMTAHPHLVGGTGRDVTVAMQEHPGLVAKDGADGVLACALPDGRAVAFKIADGSGDARRVAMGAALAAIGIEATATGELAAVLAQPVFGHGRPVGALRALEWPRSTR